MKIIYAKKFRFPNESANAIQALNMLEAFSACADQVCSFFSFDSSLAGAPESFLRTAYGREPGKLGAYTVAPPASRGLRYSLWLARHVISAKRTSLIYAREVSEARRALWFRHLHLPALPLFYEAHKFNLGNQDSPLCLEDKRKEINRFLSRVNGVIFIDKTLQEHAMEQFKFHAPSYVASAGVDVAMFSRRAAELPSSEVLVGYFGKMVEEKGVMLLAETLRFLPERYRIRFIGSVSENNKSILLRVAGAGASRVEFTGRVQHTELVKAMAGVHISVVPQILNDQIFSPLKLLESMAMGLPLVCTPIPHLKHALQDGKHALFAEDMSPEALAKAIKTLGDSPALMESMQRENRAYAEQFSWEKRAQGIVEFMRDVISKKMVR